MELKGFKTHRPVDPSDPGFTIPGIKLRWISSRVAENAPGRPWVILTKENLPKELAQHIANHNPGAFQSGNTIRRGDLVLGFSTVDAAALFRRELDEKARQQEATIIKLPSDARRMKVEHESSSVQVEMGQERFKQKRSQD